MASDYPFAAHSKSSHAAHGGRQGYQKPDWTVNVSGTFHHKDYTGMAHATAGTKSSTTGQRCKNLAYRQPLVKLLTKAAHNNYPSSCKDSWLPHSVLKKKKDELRDVRRLGGLYGLNLERKVLSLTRSRYNGSRMIV